MLQIQLHNFCIGGHSDFPKKLMTSVRRLQYHTCYHQLSLNFNCFARIVVQKTMLYVYTFLKRFLKSCFLGHPLYASPIFSCFPVNVSESSDCWEYEVEVHCSVAENVRSVRK